MISNQRPFEASPCHNSLMATSAVRAAKALSVTQYSKTRAVATNRPVASLVPNYSLKRTAGVTSVANKTFTRNFSCLYWMM